MPNRTPMAAKKRKASRLMPGSNTGSVSFFDAVWWLSGADSPRGSASWLQARVSDCQTAFKAGSDSLFVHLGSVSWSEEARSEEYTSELQSLMRISYAVFCLKKKISQ